MNALFTWLSHAVEGSAAIAFAAAFLWGVLSIMLSPCHLASIPLIVGFISRQKVMTPRRALLIASLFAGGILLTIALVGVVTAALGKMAGDLGSWPVYFVAIVLVLIGLHLLDILPLPLPNAAAPRLQRRGPLAAFALGLVFGLALGPCTFAYMAPVLAVTFRIAAAAPLFAALLLLAYGIGHCGVIVVAGTCTQAVQTYLNWNERSRGTVILKMASGLLVITGGLWLLYSAA